MKEFKELEDVIKQSYESGVTMTEAEKLAARFLHAQMVVAEKLRNQDLDARMRKSGIKAVKAAVYQDEARKVDKKPSDTYLNSLVDMSDLVQGEQGRLDEAEVDRDLLQNYYNIFREAHIYFRTVSKGSYE